MFVDKYAIYTLIASYIRLPQCVSYKTVVMAIHRWWCGGTL